MKFPLKFRYRSRVSKRKNERKEGRKEEEKKDFGLINDHSLKVSQLSSDTSRKYQRICFCIKVPTSLNALSGFFRFNRR